MKFKDIKKDLQSRFQLDADTKKETIKDQLHFTPGKWIQESPKKTIQWRFSHAYSFMGLLLLFGIGVLIAGGLTPSQDAEISDPNTPPAEQIANTETVEALYQDVAIFLEVMDLLQSNLFERSIVSQSTLIANYLNSLTIIQQEKSFILDGLDAPVYYDYVQESNGVSYTFSDQLSSLQLRAVSSAAEVTWISHQEENFEAFVQMQTGSFYLAKEGNIIRFLIEEEDIYWYVEIDGRDLYETLSYYQQNETSNLIRYNLLGFESASPVTEDPEEIIFPNSEALKGVALP